MKSENRISTEGNGAAGDNSREAQPIKAVEQEKVAKLEPEATAKPADVTSVKKA